MVSRISMGCIPIQMISETDAVKLLHRAYDYGVNFYDTAHIYTDSEAKLGAAFAGPKRNDTFIATKAQSTTYDQTIEQLNESLRRLKTDYIDLYQWHNPEKNFENFQNDHGPFQAMQDAQKAGKIRFIGLTHHGLQRAHFAIATGLFDTLQFPLSLMSTPEEIAISFRAAELDLGVIAMKGMCGGLLEDGKLAFTFLNQHRHIVPIWGLKKAKELDEFVELSKHPEPFTVEMQKQADRLKQEYGNDFCRCCGYCLPCPQGIPITLATRITTMVKRGAMLNVLFTSDYYDNMKKVDGCTHCGTCSSRCPYHLNVPRLIKEQQAAYMKMYAEKTNR